MTQHILIVEDEAEIANIEKLSLEGFDLEITHFKFAAEALEHLQDAKPDLLVLDIGLPDMSGWQFLEACKADDLLPASCSVIITTAFSDPANRVIGKLQDVTRYLAKPFSPITFKAIVVELLGLETDTD